MTPPDDVVGSVGDTSDNVLRESFVATLEGELLDRTCFATEVEARLSGLRVRRRRPALPAFRPGLRFPISPEKKHQRAA